MTIYTFNPNHKKTNTNEYGEITPDLQKKQVKKTFLGSLRLFTSTIVMFLIFILVLSLLLTK